MVKIPVTNISITQSYVTTSTTKYVVYNNDKEAKKKISKNTTRPMLENWYNSVLSDMSTVSKKSVKSTSDESDQIECYCIRLPHNSTLVFCAKCNKSQHAECANFKPKPFQEIPYLCASCWNLNEEKLQCKATLVVVPVSIVDQWINEVRFFHLHSLLCIYFYCLLKFNFRLKSILQNLL